MRLLMLALGITAVWADELQPQLMNIASQEAAIAHIGSNKAMMLYGTGDTLAVIKRWNKIEHRPTLSDEQLSQITVLENQKHLPLQVKK